MEPLRFSFKNNQFIIYEFLKTLLLVILSAILCFLSLPNFIVKEGVGLLSFISLCPLFIAVYRVKHLFASFFYGLIYAVVYFTLLLSWLYNFHPLALPLVVILRGIQYAFIFFALVLSVRVFKHKSWLFLPSVYVALQYLLECGFLALSYGNLAYSLYKYPILIQCVDLFGPFGLLFVEAAISSALSCIFLSKGGKKHIVTACVIMIVLLLSYGGFRLGQKENEKVKKEFNVIAVQHNVNSHSIDDSSYIPILDSLIDLSNKGLYENPDSSLLIWSETAVVPPVSWYLNHPTKSPYTLSADKVVSFSASIPIPLLFGNGDAVLQNTSESKELSNAKYYNAGVLIDGGRIKQKYYKQHLVPFSEYFPYKNIFPKFYNFLVSHDLTFWDKGEESIVFDIPINKGKETVKAFTPICFEDTFAYISRSGVKNGAEMLINLTNDSWSLSHASQNQHLSMGVFRSVENNVPTVRCTNSGATCYISATGRIKGTLDYFEKGYGIYNVQIKNSGHTLYAVLGDIPIICFTIAVLTLLLIGCLCAVKKEWF